MHVHAQNPALPAKDLTPLRFEPQDWSTPKDAWLVNKSTDNKWNLWSGDKGTAKQWTAGVVLQSPPVLKDRARPEEGAPPLHTRITGIPTGRYDVSIKAARTLGVSLDGKCYVGYILNWAPYMAGYDKTPENTVNPTQMWAMPIDEDDRRGILRVVDGYQYWGMCMHPYRLEDGSMLHGWTATHRAMNAEAGFRIRGAGCSTLALEDLGTGQVKHFIASYPCLDHIDFSHFDFIIPESLLYPYALLFIDVTRQAMWPISVRQFHDYGPYTASGGAGLQAQNPSPDVTKIACVSSMLCKTDVATGGPVWNGVRVIGGKRPRTALDVYNVIVRYPQPPINVRLEGKRIVWDRPSYHRETRGFNLYHSRDSGTGFKRVNARPIEALEYPLPADGGSGYYVLTSVEYSNLESRRFSEELAVDRDNAPFRHFYEAEQGELTLPMTPVFDAPGCSDGYAVAVQDPDLLWKARLASGRMGRGTIKVRIPKEAPCRLLARVRTLKPGPSGEIVFEIGGKAVGRVRAETAQWRWVTVNGSAMPLPAGEYQLSFATGSTNIALDNICITSDLDFTPPGKSNSPHTPPPVPGNIRRAAPEDADSSYLSRQCRMVKKVSRASRRLPTENWVGKRR